MKKKKHSLLVFIILLLITGLLFACSPPAAECPTDSDRFKQRLNRMELVTHMKLATVKMGKPIRATGIIVRQDEDSTLLLVAGHSAQRIEAVGGSVAASLVGPYCPTKVVAISKKHDLGLLRAECRMRGVQAKIASRPVELGEDVYVLGHTMGKPYTLTKGIVSNTQRMYGIGVRHNVFVQVDAHGLMGNSGGPLFNSKGEVVGVMSGGPFAPVWTPFGRDRMRNVMVSHMALCVPLQHIRNFLSKQEVL